LALAALITAYGVGEVVHGYGLLAVFVCAMTFRSAERDHDYHAAMHEVAERLERLLTLFVLLVLGIALTRGLLASLDWRGVAIGLALIFLVRPAAGVLGLAPLGSRSSPLTGPQRWAAAFFGVRGVGSIYYLAYAAGEVEEFGADWLWSTVGFTIVASVLVHGALASPVMRRVDPERSEVAARED
jgi:NhaP-type Na+/H+ or K+/H+ antiporter